MAAVLPEGEPPLISVVIPTRNRETLVTHAIRSVLAQSHQRLELLVVDDASTDGTASRLAALADDDQRLCVILNEAPLGGSAARNVGLQRSTGCWIAFLDDDDEWFPEKLTRQLARALEAQAIAATSAFVVESGTGRRRLVRPRVPADWRDLLTRNALGGASVLLARRDALHEIGGFDAALRSCQDWDVWLRLARHGRIVAEPTPQARYAAHGESRITVNRESAYAGHRRFYMKHREQMSVVQRAAMLALLAHFRARRSRSLRHHVHAVRLAMTRLPARRAAALARISLHLLSRRSADSTQTPDRSAG